MKLDRQQRFFLLHSLLGAFISIRVEGQENIPKGAALLICNHTDLIDAVIQGLYSGRNITFLTKAELFDESWNKRLQVFREEMERKMQNPAALEMGDELMNIIIQIYMDVSVLPIVRDFRGGSAKQTIQYYRAMLKKIKSRLKDGDLIGVYPEGTRSPDGRMQRFRGFAARIALDSRVPVVPAAIQGAYGVSDWKKWAFGQNRNRSLVYRIGKPIKPAEFPRSKSKKISIKKLTKIMEDRVRELAGK